MYSRIVKTIKTQQRLPKRQYTTEPSSSNSNGLLIGGLLVAAGTGGYMYTKKSNHDNTLKHDTEKNPMVKEKVSSDPKKPSQESQFEQGTNDNNKDTSRLVEKDTNKVRDVWEDKQKEDRTRQVAPSMSENNEGQSLWSNWFSNRDKPQNPMVHEKRTSESTKSPTENKLEAHANDVTHDTSNLVEKDTKKVEDVWNSRTSSPKEESKSLWSSIFGSSQDSNDSLNQAKSKLNDVKDDTTSMAQKDAHRLSGAWEDTKEAASAEANQLKSDSDSIKEQAKDKVNYTQRQAQSTLNGISSKSSDVYDAAQEQTQSTLNNVSDKANGIYNSTQEQAQSTWNNLSTKANGAYDTAQEQGARLTRNASDEYANTKEGANQLHREASENACQWKNEAENKTKSWYEKSVDQIRNGLDMANREVLGNNKDSDMKGHALRSGRFAEVEEGNLRPTRTQMRCVPASVVVEHARGNDM
ncbi:unnamed protein product [Rhizopus stolonifer]